VSTPNKYQPDVNIPIPVPCCPHCGKELPAVSCFQWPTPHSMTFAISCSHEDCRKILTMQIVFIADGEEAPRIQRPH
jgi:hypothetical protein